MFRYSIVNRMEAIELRACLKASQERSLLSQPPHDDDEGAAVQQMAELLQTCAELKSAFDAAVKRITALEKQHNAVCRELTSIKLTLQRPDQMQPVKSYSSVLMGAAGSTKENDESSESSLDAGDHELAATCPESINATILAAPITMTRARHLSDSSDNTITEYIAPTSTVEPAVGFTIPAKDRRSPANNAPLGQRCIMVTMVAV